MFFSTYCRIESAAGGVGCSERAFIRAAWAVLSAKGKTRATRDQRHTWLRSGLEQRQNARALVRHFAL